jgi:2'-5' RNA ligase
MGERIRAFVALRLPDAIERQVSAAVEALSVSSRAAGLKVSWTQDPHLTLLFLGMVEVHHLPDLAADLARACNGVSPLLLSLGEIGAFPSRKRPSVIWLGIGGDVAGLTSLQKEISACAKYGSSQESRVYHPHVTLARIKDSHGARLMEAVEPSEFSTSALPFDAVELIRSQVSPKGLVYTTLATIPLEGNL